MVRGIAGVRSTVSTAVLFQQLQVSPLDHVWCYQAVRFWEDVRRLPSDHAFFKIVQDNCRDAIARGVWNWAFGFFMDFIALVILYDSVRYSHFSRPIHVRPLIQRLADRV
jgi:hypothetical protein